MRSRYALAAIGGAALFACAFSASAKSGEVAITQCSGAESRTVTVDGKVNFGIGNSVGTIRSTPAGTMFDMMTSRCLGAFRIVDGKPALWGHCEWVDKDGDKVVNQFERNDSTGGMYTILHGTGKFAGIRGTREYKVTAFPAIPDGRAVCDDGVLRYELP